MKNIKLSVVIITYNEERNIAACIDAILPIADEVVVVDSFSTDKTCEIAQAKGARIVLHRFESYGAQKNFATAQAHNDYVLNLDADEMPDNQLLQSIAAVKQDCTADVYTFNRCNNYCGKWIRHGAWYPDVKMRLYNRQKGQWTNALVHESFLPNATATIQHISGDLLHYSYTSIVQHRQQVEKYSTLGAAEADKQGKKATFVKSYINPIWRFMRDFLFRLGFLDGTAGWTIAKLTAYEVYLKYRKLKALNKKKQ